MCRQEKDGYCTRRQAKDESEGEAPAQWPMRETAADYNREVGPGYHEGLSSSIVPPEPLNMFRIESESNPAGQDAIAAPRRGDEKCPMSPILLS